MPKNERETLREALRPFAEFGKYLREHPRDGLADTLYGWDNEVFIRKSDLLRAEAALDRTLCSASQRGRSHE